MNAKSVFLGRPYELTDITVQLSVSLYLHLAQYFKEYFYPRRTIEPALIQAVHKSNQLYL